MFGDAVSDFEASRDNNIKFICYITYSNVKEKMRELSKVDNFQVITEWPHEVQENI